MIAGNYTFTAQVTDHVSHVTTKAFTLNIAKATGSVCNNISFNAPGTSTPIVPLNDLATERMVAKKAAIPAAATCALQSQDLSEKVSPRTFSLWMPMETRA